MIFTVHYLFIRLIFFLDFSKPSKDKKFFKSDLNFHIILISDKIIQKNRLSIRIIFKVSVSPSINSIEQIKDRELARRGKSK